MRIPDSLPRNMHFCGIGGSGMSALAMLLAGKNFRISGSDRGFDRGQTPHKFAQLQAAGITLYPQDGSGLTADCQALIVSTAIEPDIPDVAAAQAAGIPVLKRADLLAALFNGNRGIAIGGTSGKTTVTGMAGRIFDLCGEDPTILNGGLMLDYVIDGAAQNSRAGDSDWFIAEVDESDGSIALYTPEIAVLNNITLDHKPIEELRPLFRDFIARARRGAVLNYDDAEVRSISAMGTILSYGIVSEECRLVAQAIRHVPGGSDFICLDRQSGMARECRLAVPGIHNIYNALAAIGAGLLAGLPLDRLCHAIGAFHGIHRRLETVGSRGDMLVIDDFAHNPDKIAASLATLTLAPGRLLVLFQPHGFGPMRMMRREIAAAFAGGLRPGDILFMPEIYYAGGSAVRDISSRDILADVAALGRDARFGETRDDVAAAILQEARPGDRIVIMGARDDTLAEFARIVLNRLEITGEKHKNGTDPLR